MQTARADYEVKFLCGGVHKRRAHPVLVLLKRGNRVVKDRSDATAKRFVDESRQITAQYAQVAIPYGRLQCTYLESTNALPAIIHKPYFIDRVPELPQLSNEAHLLRHVEPQAPKIDNVSALA